MKNLPKVTQQEHKACGSITSKFQQKRFGEVLTIFQPFFDASPREAPVYLLFRPGGTYTVREQLNHRYVP